MKQKKKTKKPSNVIEELMQVKQKSNSIEITKGILSKILDFCRPADKEK